MIRLFLASALALFLVASNAYAGITGTDSSATKQAVVVGELHIGNYQAPSGATVGIAASATTDGMDITVTVLDGDSTAIAEVFQFDIWMSEAATCAGLTGDTYSGSMTAVTGVIIDTQVAKKAFHVQTAATGIFGGLLVDSGNPADQYICIQHPVTGNAIPSVVSGTNWEGA